VGPHPKRKIIALPRAGGVAAPPRPLFAPAPSKSAPQPAAVAKPVARTKRDLGRVQAAQWLGQTYPAVFGVELKLLAIGVGRQLWPVAKAAGIKRGALNDALQWRTNLNAYLEMLARDGARRCDLDGNAGEAVSDEHRGRALEMAAERRRIRRDNALSRKSAQR
jgi:sRNA-binding protein